MVSQQQNVKQGLGQYQGISSQMQRNLELLQSSTVELKTAIRKELEFNPTIELENDSVSIEELQAESDSETSEAFDFLSDLNRELSENWVQPTSLSPNPDGDKYYQYQMDSLSDSETLTEHLRGELVFFQLAESVRTGCELIIGNLDERGYFTHDIAETAEQYQIEKSVLKQSLQMIQSLTPVGVGAKDLRDCLMIQLERQEMIESLEYTIVSECFEDLSNRRFDKLSKNLVVEPEGIALAIEFISDLQPNPALPFAKDSTSSISPDIVARRYNGEWELSSNRDDLPTLKISEEYKSILGKKSDPQTRAFLREKIKSGRLLIDCLQQRQDTILAVAHEILKRQPEFMNNGMSSLKPMTMVEIADAVGVHETTISRAVNLKYMSTPHGIYELRSLFTSGYTNESSGEVMSSEGVKAKLISLVKNESKKTPLTDNQIAEAMQTDGIQLARRTVAKYRDELKILPSKLRKDYV